MLNDKDYKLIYLDTNVIRALIKNISNPKIENVQRKLFFEKYIDQPDFIPCISIYNIIELNKNKLIYDDFVTLFSDVEFFLILPHKFILEEETKSAINNIKMPLNYKIVYFVSSAKNNQYTIIDIINKILSAEEYEKYLKELVEISQSWLSQRSELFFKFKQYRIPTDFKTIEKYCKGVEYDSIISNLSYYKINGNNIALENIPGSRIMLYSQYNRVHLSKKDIKVNDVMDVQLTCIAPYMDIIYTEAYQADIYKKSKKFIPQMNNIEILTLRDLK